jgi:hypothetical protein
MTSLPSLNEAISLSLHSWQADLKSIFVRARECFADVVCEPSPIPVRNNDDGLSIKYAYLNAENYLVASGAGVTGGESVHMQKAVVSGRVPP